MIKSWLVHCWTSVLDGGPTINQPWVNFLCLLGSKCREQGVKAKMFCQMRGGWQVWYSIQVFTMK